jgi:hypothetical protein
LSQIGYGRSLGSLNRPFGSSAAAPRCGGRKIRPNEKFGESKSHRYGWSTGIDRILILTTSIDFVDTGG